MKKKEINLKKHSLSDVQSENIGKGTTIWQYAIILKNAEIGENCNINCHTFVENDVIIGNNVTVKSGIYLWDGITLENDVFLGPNVVFTNDLFPRSKRYAEPVKTLIKQGASVGANSTILAGITIGKYSLSGIASVITKDVPNYALVYGNPAKIMGWVDEEGKKMKETKEGVFKCNNGNLYDVIDNNLKKR